MSDRRLTRASLAALGALLLAGLTGCRGTEIEDAIDQVDWFSNMRDQPALEPFEEPARMPPEGVVAVGAGVPLGTLPDDYDDVPNPVLNSASSLERGKEQYDIFCSVCHGPEGRGDGSIEGFSYNVYQGDDPFLEITDPDGLGNVDGGENTAPALAHRYLHAVAGNTIGSGNLMPALGEGSADCVEHALCGGLAD